MQSGDITAAHLQELQIFFSGMHEICPRKESDALQQLHIKRNSSKSGQNGSEPQRSEQGSYQASV